MAIQQFLSIKESAEKTRLTEKAIRQRLARGGFPYRRMGRRIFIPTADLEKFLRELPGCSAEEALRRNNEIRNVGE